MTIIATPGNLKQINQAWATIRRFYDRSSVNAWNDIERRLARLSHSVEQAMPGLHEDLSHFQLGRCVLAVNAALEASNRRLLQMMTKQLAGLDFSTIKTAMWEAAEDVVLYIGGGAVLGASVGGALGFIGAGIGAGPGAAAGAAAGIKIGTAILTLMGLEVLIESMLNTFPAMATNMAEGFAFAWRAGELHDDQRADKARLMQAATERFAEGKLLLYVSILSAVSLLLTKKSISQELLIGELGKSRLGKGFADWVALNRDKLATHPGLRRHTAGAGAVTAKTPAPANTVPTTPPAAAPKKHSRSEGEASGPCPECVLVGSPVNPISGSKILAGESELDFALPAPLPFVWQRKYSSSQRETGWMGQGWTTPLSLALQVGVDEVVVLDAYSRDITFSLPQIGESLYSPSEKITLTRSEEHRFELSGADGARSLFTIPETGHNIARLIGQVDANGNRLGITYSNRQLPETVEDGAGRVFKLAFDDHHGHPRLRNITVQCLGQDAAAAELLVQYEYDAAGDLCQVSNGQSEVMRQFAYRNQVMVEHSQPGGLVSRYEYDEYAASGKVTRNWTNSGLAWSLRYLDRQTLVTDKLGREQRFSFDDKGRLIGRTEADGGRITHNLDSNGNVLAVIDAGGRSTHYRYDQRSRVIRIESAGRGTGIVYDTRFDKPALITDAMGATTVLRYDDQGNLASVTDALGQRTAYQYDACGLPVRVIDAAGGVKRLAYNRAAQLISYTDCSNNSTHFSYDDNGNLLRVTDAVGNVTKYRYDRSSRLIAAVQTDGAAERYDYDALGRLTASIDAAGNRTSYVLDSDGKPLKRVDARGGVLEYRYDAARRIAELINENGDAHRFVYDTLDRLAEETGFDARLTRYRYDASGLLAVKEEFGSAERTAFTRIDTHYLRDQAGRLIDKIVSRTTGEAQAEQIRLRYAYDPVGRMTQAVNADAEVTLQYDALGQLVGERTSCRGETTELRHAYDELGNRIKTILPDGRVLNNLIYGSGHLHQINIDGEVITDIERDKLHRATSRTQGALTSQFRYDPVGRLLSQVAGHLTVGQGVEPVIARRYEYDDVGNLLAIDDQRNGRKTYSYDVIGRIMTAVQPNLAERFAFDPAHNLLDATVASAGRIEGNRMRVFENKRYDYDAHGNLTEKLSGRHTRLRLEWNATHQLVKSFVTHNAQDPKPTVQMVKYAYDAFGRRIAKRDAFGTTRFVWDGNRLLCEARGQWTRTYVYEPGSFVPLAQIESVAAEGDGARPCTVQYIHADHLGTPNEVTGQDGEITWASEYKAWGNVLRVVGVAPRRKLRVVEDAVAAQNAVQQAQPIRFLGQYHDSETGLHYNRFRYYDADCARYVSLDPIGLAGGNNAYQYAPNPTGWTDPLGLTKEQCACGVAGALVGANFSQKASKPNKNFSDEGIAKYSKLAGQAIHTVSDLTEALQRGDIKPNQLPIDFVDLNGTRLILNTRTSTALEHAGIPRKEWYGVDKTDVKAYDGVTFNDLALAQLRTNGYPSTGRP